MAQFYSCFGIPTLSDFTNFFSVNRLRNRNNISIYTCIYNLASTWTTLLITPVKRKKSNPCFIIINFMENALIMLFATC